MKKNKLISLLSVCAILLCSCSLSDDEDVYVPVTIENYTVNFTFTRYGEATTLPEYARMYIIGDWDGWSSFLPLDEHNGIYSYTFSSIDTGYYGYLGVMWYEDEEVDWDHYVTVISTNGGNATLTISELDNGSQTVTRELTATLEKKLTEEDKKEIATSILEEASSYQKADELGYECYFFESTTESEDTYSKNTYYLSSVDGYTYGSWTYDNGEYLYYRYFLDGTMYIHDGSLVGNEAYTTQEQCEDYDFAIKEYTKPFVFALEAVESLETFAYDVSYYEDGYKLEIDEYTYIVDESYKILSLSSSDESSSETLKKIDETTLERAMSNFSTNGWSQIEDVTDLFSRIEEDQNFTLEIEYYEVYSEYYSDYNALLEDYANDELEYGALYYIVDISYTKDAVLYEYYMYDGEDYIPYDVVLYVNDYDSYMSWVYYTLSDDLTDLYRAAGYYGYWQDNLDSVLSFIPYTSVFIKGESEESDYGEIINYSIEDNLSVSTFSLLIDSFFSADNYFNDYDYFAQAPYNMNMLYGAGEPIYFDGIFYSEYGEFDMELYTDWVGYYDLWYGAYWIEMDIMGASIFNISRTLIDTTYSEYI